MFAVGAALHAAEVFGSDEPVPAPATIAATPYDLVLQLPTGPKVVQRMSAVHANAQQTLVERFTPLPLRTQCTVATAEDGQTSVALVRPACLLHGASRRRWCVSAGTRSSCPSPN